ncbi:putative transcription factor C2H2 family [Helianthus annuus]|nr:putative transcription factor C2H2 family [Helianthus annuus]KAJ0778052.1 putative transcription factor C2H2 family [Helianthus annuus]KAJ0940921.1 putative transcription factor C2H2 family [Helianthus annuus]KAJ0952688.1 putative transcription factor C2H2 family [Helianthus annuus]
MNKPTKPISSPGRTTTTTTEKFPPPLMRFLRSNVGNKSRRRSRASPMFVRKKNTLIETTQEPSSPKVTCIGQVRVSRSKKKNHKTTTATTTNHHHRNRLCRCLRTIKPFSCTNVWSKWVTLFRCWKCGNSRTNTNNAPQHQQHQQEENHQGEEQKQERVSFFRCCGSYKNSRKHKQHQQKQHLHQQEQHQQEENLQEEEEQKQELVSFFRCGSYKNSGKHRQHQQKQHVEQHQQGENRQEGEEKQKQELISFFRSYKNSGKNKQERQKEPEDVQHVTTIEVDNINESLISRTPPKNAFLLTRCRSAPYRSSSLANMFRESMMERSDEEVEDTMKKLKIEKEDDDEEEDEGTCNEGEELKEVPLILGRCKSEPARTWDQLLRV